MWAVSREFVKFCAYKSQHSEPVQETIISVIFQVLLVFASLMAALMMPVTVWVWAIPKNVFKEHKYTVSEVSWISKGGVEIHMAS